MMNGMEKVVDAFRVYQRRFININAMTSMNMYSRDLNKEPRKGKMHHKKSGDYREL